MYIGLNMAPGGVARVDLSHLKEIGQALRFSTGEDAVYSLAVDGGFLYAGLYTSPGRIIKINLADFTVQNSIILGHGRNWVSCLAIDGGYLYAGLRLWPGTIVKVDLKSFTITDILELRSGENNIYSLVVRKGFLFANNGMDPGGVAKIDLSSFREVDSLRLAPGEGYSQSLVTVGDYLYTGFYERPGGIARIDLINFREMPRALMFRQGEDRVWALFSDGEFLYAGLDTRPGRIVKSSLDLRQLDSLVLQAGENGAFAFVQWRNRTFVGIYSTPGKIIELVQESPASALNVGTLLFIGIIVIVAVMGTSLVLKWFKNKRRFRGSAHRLER
jgi:hypothetical protein